MGEAERAVATEEKYVLKELRVQVRVDQLLEKASVRPAPALPRRWTSIADWISLDARFRLQV